eukprot:jgi/Tetstr1/437601/TSEL_026268.t1
MECTNFFEREITAGRHQNWSNAPGGLSMNLPEQVVKIRSRLAGALQKEREHAMEAQSRQEGYTAFRRRDMQVALEAYNKATRLSPLQRLAHSNRDAKVNLKLKNPADAADDAALRVAGARLFEGTLQSCGPWRSRSSAS